VVLGGDGSKETGVGGGEAENEKEYQALHDVRKPPVLAARTVLSCE